MTRSLLVSALAVGLLACSARADWETFVIRGTASGAAPGISDNTTYGVSAKEFKITEGGQKAGWGTSDLDGRTIGQISTIKITRLDDSTDFAATAGARYAPYINIWITNGAGQYAVIANEPSNAEWIGTTEWNMNWDILKTKTLKVYETSDKSWLPNSGVGLTFADIADFKIQAPSVSKLTSGWTGLGSGAPRELVTNKAFGFNWVFGDTLSNYTNPRTDGEGYVVANPIVTAVPLPAAAWGGLGLMGALGVARVIRPRKQA